MGALFEIEYRTGMAALNIQHSKEKMQEIIAQVTAEAEGIVMKPDAQSGGRNIAADTECDETYESGIRQTDAMKIHIQDAVSFMEQIDTILSQADETAARMN